MRNPRRIKELLDLISEIWETYPDLRFNQLIYSLQSGYSNKNGDIGQINDVASDGFTRTGFDLFNLEDDEFIRYVQEVKSSGKF